MEFFDLFISMIKIKRMKNDRKSVQGLKSVSIKI
jgi:hypothetical protein